MEDNGIAGRKGKKMGQLSDLKINWVELLNKFSSRLFKMCLDYDGVGSASAFSPLHLPAPSPALEWVSL